MQDKLSTRSRVLPIHRYRNDSPNITTIAITATAIITVSITNITTITNGIITSTSTTSITITITIIITVITFTYKPQDSVIVYAEISPHGATANASAQSVMASVEVVVTTDVVVWDMGLAKQDVDFLINCIRCRETR